MQSSEICGSYRPTYAMKFEHNATLKYKYIIVSFKNMKKILFLYPKLHGLITVASFNILIIIQEKSF